MLPLDVRASLAELIENVYTRAQLELLANKFGIEPRGNNKLTLAKDFLSKLPKDREKELIEKVILDARRARWNSDVCRILPEFERVLEGSMLCSVDKDGRVTPIVEPSIKPDIEKQKGLIEQQMEELNFNLAYKHFRDALKTYKASYPGSIALFRNSLQALVEGMIREQRKKLCGGFKDNVVKLTEIGVLKKLEKKEEVEAVYALFKMLSHYGSHPEDVTEEVVNFLYPWTISSLLFLLKRYKKFSHVGET